jgi:inward rectifier potassium channel
MKISDFTSPLFNNRKPDDNDLGFGTKITSEGTRLVNKDGSFNIERNGANAWAPYLWLVEMSWSRFFLVVGSFYFMVNALFALGFVLIGVDTLAGMDKQGFLADFGTSFFFSVQTFTTVGYGALNPNSFGADLLSAIVALVGLMSFALATGLFFSRFSKPKAQILFSEISIIAPYQDISSFQFRIANTRNNNIIDVEAKVAMTWIEHNNDQRKRRFTSLELEREKIALLPLNWTIVHPIDEKSPLYQKSKEDLEKMQVEFIVQIKAYDETFAQQVNTNSSYIAAEMLWEKKFEGMYYPNGSTTVLDLDKIDAVYDAPVLLEK